MQMIVSLVSIIHPLSVYFLTSLFELYGNWISAKCTSYEYISSGLVPIGYIISNSHTFLMPLS